MKNSSISQTCRPFEQKMSAMHSSCLALTQFAQRLLRRNGLVASAAAGGDVQGGFILILREFFLPGGVTPLTLTQLSGLAQCRQLSAATTVTVCVHKPLKNVSNYLSDP